MFRHPSFVSSVSSIFDQTSPVTTQLFHHVLLVISVGIAPVLPLQKDRKKCSNVCFFARVSALARLHAHTHTHTHTLAYTDTQTHTHTHTHTHTYTHTHTHSEKMYESEVHLPSVSNIFKTPTALKLSIEMYCGDNLQQLE